MRFIPLFLLLLAPAGFAAAPAAPQAQLQAAAQPPAPMAQKSTTAHFLELYIFQIFAVMAALTAASEAVGNRRPEYCRFIRKSWNWALLLSLLSCVLLGFLLLLPLDKPLKNLFFRLHIWTGTAAAWAALYHTARHYRAMLPAR
jgi:hypothetical protein